MEIIDNFLSKEEFENIKNFMESVDFPWFYNDHKVIRGDGQFQFTHTFFTNTNDKGKNSSWLDMWNNYIYKINAKECYRIKANMNIKTISHEPSLWHNDLKHNINCPRKTSVFYINDNNGYTEFRNGDRIESVANRAIIFDNNLEHRGVSHTLPDHYRIVVNFNYS
tara:strand:- start:164 stop:661 length:498 start_codon:yes stop_codon:yes gene_type:complete